MTNARRVALFLSVVFTLLSVSVTSSKAQVTEVVGATAGEFGVTPSGSASYSIPITVPPGTAGVQTKLTLQWSSAGGNAGGGIGWSVGGLSFITRCAKDLYFDGEITAVDFSVEDRFCLNGQKIVAVTGTYGADGATYHTAFEEFSFIVSKGQAGTGPEYFEVRRKSGEIFHYGKHESARIQATGRPEIRIWALNQIRDQHNNAINFFYDEDTTTGEFHLSRVEYTINTTQSVVAYNAVDFIYETRPDTVVAYQAGSKISLTKRLTNVKAYSGAALYRDYQITYGAGISARSRITSVQECANDGTCFPATAFAYDVDGPQQFDNKLLGTNDGGITGSAFANYKVLGSGDFNGDGLTDLFVVDVDAQGRAKGGPNADYIWTANGDGTFTNDALPSGESMLDDYIIGGSGDFNGDGLTDLYLFKADAEGQSNGDAADYVWISEGDRTFTSELLTTATKSSGITGSAFQNYSVGAVGDFNGDGLADLYLMETIGSSTSRTTGKDADYVFLAEVDANGNFTGFDNKSLGTTGGLKGTYIRTYQTCTPPGKNGNPVCTTHNDTHWTYENYTIAAQGDFNGDGMTDLYLWQANSIGEIATPTQALGFGGNNLVKPDHIWLAKGDGTFEDVELSATEGATFDWVGYGVGAQGDFNGDGLTDLYMMQKDDDGQGFAATTDHVWLSKGDQTFETISLAAAGIHVPNDYKIMATGDFNGDGLTDIYSVRTQDGNDSNRFSAVDQDRVFLSKGDGTFTEVILGATSGVTGGIFWNHTVAATGDFNGDGLTDIYTFQAGQELQSSGDANDYVWLSDWKRPDVMASITNGLGLTTEVDFEPLTKDSVYTKGTTIPLSGDTGLTMEAVSNSIGAGYVVSQIRADNGIGGQNAQTYKYEALRTHRLGFGNLGFEKMSVTDVPTGIVSESTYSQDYTQHHQGLLTNSRTIEPDNSYVLEEQTVTWKVRWLPDDVTRQRCFRFADKTVTTKRDLNNAPISTVTEETIYDDYGFPTKITMTTTDGTDTFTKITDNTYVHQGYWRLGRLTEATVTHKATGQPDQVRKSSFTYEDSGSFTGTGILLSETIEPDNLDLFHTKTYAHNAFGAVTSVTETWGSNGNDGITETSRTSTFVYDTKSRHRIEEYNSKNHKQQNFYDPLHGLLNKTIGPNGVPTEWEFDAFGRTTKEIRADGTNTTTNRHFCGNGVWCPANGALRIVTQTTGAPKVTVIQDKLYREIFNATVSLDGTFVYVKTEYDDKGRVLRKSEPYFAGATTIHWTNITYDVLGRPLVTTRPDNSTQSMTYNGLEQVSTNELSQTKTVRADALGRTIEVLDTQSNSTTYVYDAIGQQISMSDAQANTITTDYDIRGNKTSMIDPDKGTWTYRYNALGLLVEQTDAKGQRTDVTYDVLERMLTRTDDATGTPQTATWTYDTATKGVGKLAQVTSTGYTGVSTYDSLGRPSSSTETVGAEVHTLSTTYDSSGRVEDTVYPTGLTVRNVYNTHGHLEVVKNASSALEYWKALAADERGNITHFRLGNGVESQRLHEPETGTLDTIKSWETNPNDIQDLQYTFDDLGNLTKRQDHNQTLSEDFTYDTLNRVTQVDTVLSPTVTNTVTIAYDILGNITNKSDVGTYTYGQAHVACTSGHAGPHAVTTVVGTKNATYCYDANGNMTSGDGRTVTYSAFDKPTHIVKGTNTTTISYGPDRARFKRVDVATGGTTVTIYVGGKAFEKISRPGGNIERKHYIGGFAVVTEIDDGTTTTAQTDYLLRDHLGSVDIITDELGQITRQISFDAWGKRREVNWTAMVNPTLYMATITTRGFTGHEQLDGVGLVHMNGRVYDPELGRFLSADPVLQDNENLQAWNRYSYVLNNPLSFTDPDGFFFKKLFKAIGKAFGKIFKFIKANFKAILRIAITAAACAGPQVTVTCVAVTVGTSFGFTLADGGSLGDALKAAAFSAAQVGVWTGVGAFLGSLQIASKIGFAAVKGAVHGVVGGAISVAQGGNFLQGFGASAISGAVGVFAGPESGLDLFTSTALVATAGGVAAKLTGGKFANGALTAAFANIFNNWKAAWLGSGAHKTLQNYLKRMDARWRSEVYVKGKGFIDLLFSELYAYEIKPYGQDVIARVQLDKYLDKVGNMFLPGPSHKLPFNGRGWFSLRDDSWLAPQLGFRITYTYWRSRLDGVITYKAHVNSDAFWKAWARGPNKNNIILPGLGRFATPG